ncbi:hypothetical protein C6N75_23610 [Streptomyces solincola]|uniref:Uncharacterized protein n=2 Tax=Streptomyces solincola TaxID=2100817 RepID=A0A2S9PQV9_9ACTN|nr:hypothetical protein C6N75_23610 [Streptomyces solincola]
MDVHDFPPDLLHAQTAWYAAYRRLAVAEPAASPTAARRELLELSGRIAAHPYWAGPAGTPAARMELKEIAHAQAAHTGEGW